MAPREFPNQEDKRLLAQDESSREVVEESGKYFTKGSIAATAILVVSAGLGAAFLVLSPRLNASATTAGAVAPHVSEVHARREHPTMVHSQREHPVIVHHRMAAESTTDTTSTTMRTTKTKTTTTRIPEVVDPKPSQKYTIIHNPDNSVSLLSRNGQYLAVQGDGALSAGNRSIGDRESFRLVEHDDDFVSLRSLATGKLAHAGGSTSAKLEKFKRIRNSDGTVSLTSGSSFLKPAGSRSGRFAIYSRNCSAFGAREKFHVALQSDGSFALKTLHGTYVTVDSSGALTSESDDAEHAESFKLIEHKGLVSFKTGSGRFITAYGNGSMTATAKHIGDLQKFRRVRHGDGVISFRTLSDACVTVSTMPIMTFYMYRAMGEAVYPMTNVNTGNLGGVLWYVHHEVVLETPRRFGIDRIIRMKVQATSTKYLAEKGLNFGPRFAYDAGMCTGAGPINGWNSCTSFYEKYGHFLGCNYLGDYPFPMASKGYPSRYEEGMWYSLPKEGNCLGAPTGEDNCTYSYEMAGHLEISELYGVDNYWVFIQNKKNKEYDPKTDAGVGCTFFDHIMDAKENAKRVKHASKLFNEKYPDQPKEEELMNPVCDFNCDRFYTEDEMQKVGKECKCSESEAALRFSGHAQGDTCAPDKSSGLLKGLGFYNNGQKN